MRETFNFVSCKIDLLWKQISSTFSHSWKTAYVSLLEKYVSFLTKELLEFWVRDRSLGMPCKVSIQALQTTKLHGTLSAAEGFFPCVTSKMHFQMAWSFKRFWAQGALESSFLLWGLALQFLSSPETPKINNFLKFNFQKLWWINIDESIVFSSLL